MIKYALACEQAHEFESWFPSSEAFETQRKRGYVTCPYCNSAKVEKQVMAPSVARTDKAPKAPTPEVQPVAVLSERERDLRSALRALREHVLKNAEDVGKGFVEEARKMYYGETEERSIYGEADLAEAQALLEEGIDVLPLPVVPDDRN
ncbi:DUF1178 family protein [Microvirga tunisiensis]|jgi:hypothetical protein|uniref:DUF1178 family protein n=1 Tax=Microvirga tunisiensis TaxID=2108360 RepID=A0A5N7MLC6_9HYPH|nr:DUF1178 family protein [Microvirga tunisiensis]MPR09613.1 DUF1178 family protein [Microvirga tunisiensis]MPR27797.1 DUF1178 family protein [Microvirga tunisiensis]